MKQTIRVQKIKQRNPLVVPVMRKGVRKHKNKKREFILNGKGDV